MAKYAKRKDGLYCLNRKINGKRKVFYGKTCREIDEKLAAYMAERQDGRMFEEVAAEWWEIKKMQLAANSVQSYTPAYNRLVKAFSGRRVASITTPELLAYMMEFARQGYHKSSGNTELTVLKQILKHAVLCGEIEVSPAVEIKVPQHMPTDKIPPLTEEQEAAAKAYQSGEAGLLVQLLLYTGLRIGEAAGLTYADIDRKTKTISIRRKVSYAYGNRGDLEDHLKTKNGRRDLPLMSPLAKLLPRDRIGYVFAGDDGGWMPSQRIYKLWEQFCEDCGYLGEEGKPSIHPHQMRHTYATILYEAGVDLKTAAAWMGDTEAVVSKVYQALRPKTVEDSRGKVEAYLQEKEA